MAMTRIGFDFRWHTGTLLHYVENLLKQLVAQGKGKFQFVCYSHRKDTKPVTGLDGLVEIRDVPWSRYSLNGQLAFPKLLRQDNVKLFHSPFYMMPFFSRVPSVVTIHDVIPFLRYTDKRGLNRLTICALNRLAVHRASAIITVSEMSKKDIVRVLDVSESKVKVAPCGVGSYATKPPNADLYREHFPYFACMTARHFEAKNTSAAIKAWKIFRARTGQPHKLLIGGKTSPEGQACFLEIGCEGDCQLLGFIPDENLSSFLHNATAVIVPSLYEGFGLPALEAMVCGAPLISSNRASLPEVGGSAALYFDAEDIEDLACLMARVADDRDLRSRMVVQGRAQAQKFSYAESAERIMNVYQEVLRTPR
jgi:glycosyltransferase involved in cell wall biosynthesis